MRIGALAACVTVPAMLPACCWSSGPDLRVVETFDPETTTQRERDEGVLRQLRLAGADMTRETEIIHYLYFSTEDEARAAAGEIGAGFELEIGALGSQWALVARHHQVPTLDNLEAAELVLIPAATRHGGEYDGWEAAVTP